MKLFHRRYDYLFLSYPKRNTFSYSYLVGFVEALWVVVFGSKVAVRGSFVRL